MSEQQLGPEEVRGYLKAFRDALGNVAQTGHTPEDYATVAEHLPAVEEALIMRITAPPSGFPGSLDPFTTMSRIRLTGPPDYPLEGEEEPPGEPIMRAPAGFSEHMLRKYGPGAPAGPGDAVQFVKMDQADIERASHIHTETLATVRGTPIEAYEEEERCDCCGDSLTDHCRECGDYECTIHEQQ